MRNHQKAAIITWALLLIISLILMIWDPCYPFAIAIGYFIGGILIMSMDFPFMNLLMRNLKHSIRLSKKILKNYEELVLELTKLRMRKPRKK